MIKNKPAKTLVQFRQARQFYNNVSMLADTVNRFGWRQHATGPCFGYPASLFIVIGSGCFKTIINGEVIEHDSLDWLEEQLYDVYLSTWSTKK